MRRTGFGISVEVPVGWSAAVVRRPAAPDQAFGLDRYRGWVVGVGFGSQLGFGLVTIVTSATTYAVALLCALSGSPTVGLLVGGTFGLVRALPSAFVGRVVTREQLWRLLARVELSAPTADVAARLALAAGAAALTLIALRGLR